MHSEGATDLPTRLAPYLAAGTSVKARWPLMKAKLKPKARKKVEK